MSGGCDWSDYGHRSRCPPSGLAVDETVPSGKFSQYQIRQSTLGYFPGQFTQLVNELTVIIPGLFLAPKSRSYRVPYLPGCSLIESRPVPIKKSVFLSFHTLTDI